MVGILRNIFQQIRRTIMNNGVPPRMKFSFRYLKITPFFILKYLRKLNKTI